MKLSEIIKQAIEIGMPQGQITFDEINDLCGNQFDAEDIEQLIAALNDADILIVEK